MAETGLPTRPTAGEAFKGLGRLIHIAGSGAEGTKIYVKHPDKFTMDTQPIKEFQIYGNRSIKDTGIESGRLHSLLFKKNDRYYQTTLTQTPDDGGEFVWKTVGAVSFIDNNGDKITIPRNELTLRKPKPSGEGQPQIFSPSRDAALHEDFGEEIDTPVLPLPTAPEPGPMPEGTPVPTEEPISTPEPTTREPIVPPTPLRTLEDRATEMPISLSLIGLDAEQIILSQAGKDMEKIAAEGGNWFQRLTRGIWKGNVAHELLEEHAYQFRHKLTDAAHMIMSDETITAIESRADSAYTEALNKKNKFGQSWIKFKDAVARNVGGYTSKENLAIAQVGEMYAAGELAGIQQYEDGLAAVRKRFEQDFLDADGVIRENLGEYREILTSGDPKHQEMMTGIKDLIHKYAGGEIATKAELDSALTEFAKTYTIGADPKTGRAAQLYASSLYRVAENIKQRVSSGEAMSAIDTQLDAMEIRIGRAQVGEATQVERTTTQKTVDWLMQKNIVGTVINNEATLGTAVAAAISLSILPRVTVSKFARLAGGAVGGGAVAGAIAGVKENTRMRREWFQFMRQRETGAGLPQPGDKLRTWMAEREIPQVSVTELTSRITATAYENGTLKPDLSGEDLTKTLAYLADAKARRSLSARGGENVSLIRWGPAVDVERTNLDLSIDKLERDLLTKFGPTTQPELQNKNITNYTKLLTDVQTKVLSQGRDAVSLSDPLKTALNAVSDHDPAVTKYRRRLLIYGQAQAKGEVQGLNDALAEIKTQIRLEAVRRGVNTAVIGASIGTALSEGGYLIAHHDEVMTNIQHMLHIGPQVTSEIPVVGHLTDIPAIPHFTDSQGIDHVLNASIPEHTSLLADPGAHTFTLMDANNHALVHGIAIDTHGQIANTDALNSSRDALEHGLHFGNNSYEVTTPGTVQHIQEIHEVPATAAAPPVEHISAPSSTLDLHASDWDDRGFWGWAEKRLGGETFKNHEAAINSVKNALRSYEKNFATDGTNHVTNVDVHPPSGITQTIPYHATPGTPMGGTEMYYNALPQSAIIHDVPASLFSDQGMTSLAHITDEAATSYTDGLAHGLARDQIIASMDRLHQIALKAYFGREQDMFTKDDLQYLMDHLGGAPPIPVPPPETIPTFVTTIKTVTTMPTTTTLYQGIINQTATQVTTAVPEAVPLVTELPAVVPLPREGMKPGKQSNMLIPKIPETPPREVYANGVSLPELQKWLKENPNRLQTYRKIVLEDGSFRWVDKEGKPIMRDIKREHAVLSMYFEGIKNSDPKYFEYLTHLSQEPTMPAMQDECRVSVNIPAWMEGKIVHHTLTEYTGQTDQSGSPLNPNAYEINIIINRKTGSPSDNTVQEIQRFIDERKSQGKNFKINYVDVEFDPPKNNVGHARKVITDLALLRSLQRTGATQQLYIETEDADLIRVDPHTVTNLITKLDTNPHLDAVSGIQDRYPEILMQNDYLFLDRRLWDFTGTMLQRRNKYRPENNPNWHNWWHRTITGGWNTGYTAEAYALIGGHDSGLTMGEDTIIGEKISMIRGDGKNPNLDVVGTVSTRSDSSPRRFINEVITGKGAYTESFTDEELNIRLKTAPLEELLTMISPVARISPDNEESFRNMISWRLDQLKNLSVNNVEAVKDFQLAMTFLGFKNGDFDITPDGHVHITNLDNIKLALEDYRHRHQAPREPGKRTSYGSVPVIPTPAPDAPVLTPTPEPATTPEPPST